MKKGATRLGQRFSLNYEPMNCQVKRQNGKMYYGVLVQSGNWIESEDICVAVCWQYKAQGFPCNSVNYISWMKKCELMSDIHGENGATGKMVDESTSNYIVPIKCDSKYFPNFW